VRVLVVLVMVGVFASGCAQLRGSLSLSREDRVSGEILVVRPRGADPVAVQPPADLAREVEVRPYSIGGRTGVLLRLHELTFDELARLGAELGPPGTELQVARSGSQVTFEATADLRNLPGTEVRLELSAPGEVTATTGDRNGGEVLWQPRAGQISHLRTTFEYEPASAWSWVVWSVLSGTLGLSSAGLVGWLAQRDHRNYRAAASGTAP
jgi:hypothetical protein